MVKPLINIAEIELQPRPRAFAATGDAAQRFDAKMGLIAPRIGAQKLGYNITAVPPGKRAFPFHNHRINEEMFFILEGTGELRFGANVYPVQPGDIIACPPGGKENAHQIVNTGEVEMKYLAVSTKISPEVGLPRLRQVRHPRRIPRRSRRRAASVPFRRPGKCEPRLLGRRVGCALRTKGRRRVRIAHRKSEQAAPQFGAEGDRGERFWMPRTNSASAVHPAQGAQCAPYISPAHRAPKVGAGSAAIRSRWPIARSALDAAHEFSISGSSRPKVRNAHRRWNASE